MDNKWVVVTTASRPWLVVPGRELSRDADTITLEEARVAVSWTRAVQSVMGLARTGPCEGSRISHAAVEVTVRWETIISATEEATAAWRKEPWV